MTVKRSGLFIPRLPRWFGCIAAFGTFICGPITAAEVDFDTEIVPLLSKAGCNAASCHGSAAGQADFRLSLFGGDPELDHRMIVHELSGRRIDFGQPNESLLIQKATAQLDHGGEDVWQPEDESVRTVQRWIASGAQRRQLRRLDRLIVEPSEFVSNAIPASVGLHVTAIFDDGVHRDVTNQAIYVSQNESALVIDPAGEAKLSMPGQHFAIVKFAGRSALVSFTTPIGNDDFDASLVVADNWIDEAIVQKLRQLRISPVSITEDAAFLRRVSLDLTGRLPSPEQLEQFIAREDADKRSSLINSLLASDQFVDFWTHRVAIDLRFRKPGQDSVALNAMYGWLRQQIAEDVGWNQIASELILSEGDSHQSGAATVHRFFATAREEAEYVSEVLMGVRLRCANCHNHPLDQWTQDDYHGLAAVFAGWQRGRKLSFSPRRTIIHPRTDRPALPRLPAGEFLASEKDHRRALADWLTDKDNPYFAKAMVGRVWQNLMGRGLVSPVDDLRVTNPATHPEMFDRLADFFQENDFQLRPLVRLICNSAAYQRSSGSSRTGSLDQASRYYAVANQKPLSAEVLADAIDDVSGVTRRGNKTRRAIKVIDRATLSETLQYLGQCQPGNGCSPASRSDRGIASKLHLMNGELLNKKIASHDGRLQQMLNRDVAVQEIVSQFYLRALTRPPSNHELTTWTRQLDTPDEVQKRQRCEDFLWALMNTQEFTHNR
ncbi:DUF1553 domain-containing protein [Rhodopirellula baltica]|uniref:Secreted protein containing DUF1549 n=1 Tax=Rhodopirellula baltica SWK14 TaxID=993516 RepID=L7CFD8_RHOBT|nr:DUF1553 domain-containing protein [Rhodopirellula baltica]ELP32743.1 secreted protein containing DUF1549 [Rhodopirellula baltica SWK14]